MHPGFNKVFSALVGQNPGVCLPACTSSGNYSAYRLPGLCSLSSLIEPHPMYSQFSIQPKSHGGLLGIFGPHSLPLLLNLSHFSPSASENSDLFHQFSNTVMFYFGLPIPCCSLQSLLAERSSLICFSYI